MNVRNKLYARNRIHVAAVRLIGHRQILRVLPSNTLTLVCRVEMKTAGNTKVLKVRKVRKLFLG